MRNVYAAKHNFKIVTCSAMQKMRLCDTQQFKGLHIG